MIERKGANFVLNEAKNVGIASATAKLFNDVQNKICPLQPIDEFLNSFNNKKALCAYYEGCFKSAHKLESLPKNLN